MSLQGILMYELGIVQEVNYMSVIVITAIGYDYILTFSKEVECIWTKPWTWVSTMFIFVRYVGLLSCLVPTLGTSFVPGPLKVAVRGEIFLIIYQWTFLLFLCPANLVMILRVWVMYHRSRLILGILLALLSFEVISMILAGAIYSNPNNLEVAVVDIVYTSFCVAQTVPYAWTYVTTILQVTLGATMCILVIAQFVRQSTQMYTATKQWQLNRYVRLTVKEGTLYFFGVLLYSIVNMLYVLNKAPLGGWRMLLLLIMAFVPIYTLPPRFIMSIRELYARDAEGVRSRGEVDTGFGLSSSPGRATVGTRILFAAVEEDAELEEIPI